MLSRNTPPGAEITCIRTPRAQFLGGLVIVECNIPVGSDHILAAWCSCSPDFIKIPGADMCLDRRCFRAKVLPPEITEHLDVVKRDIPELVE